MNKKLFIKSFWKSRKHAARATNLPRIGIPKPEAALILR